MLASHERGAVSIQSSSFSASSKPGTSITAGSGLKQPDPIKRTATDTNHVRLASVDQTDSYSLSSVDVIDSNDLKYMDDSTSSSSTSSISGGIDVCSSSTSTASMSPTAAQSSHSQDTLKFDSRSPLACPISNGSDVLNCSVSQPLRASSSSTPLVNGQRSGLLRYSLPVQSSGKPSKPSRIPVLTSLGRVRLPVDVRNGSSTYSDDSMPNNNHCSPTNSPTNSAPRTPVQQRNAETNHATLPEPSSANGLNSLMHPHSPSDYNANSQSLPNGDVSRLFCDRTSPERSPAAPMLCSTNRDDSGVTTNVTNGFCVPDFEEDNRLRELLAMVSDSESDTESIAESIYHQPPKAADRSAASRLAKRLFHLDGFRITDVAKHLCKRNDFSQLVGEEFASLFDFSNQRLDTALRTFLNTFSLTGESQERERILLHFSRRYHACNPGTYPNEEVCHTLVCALMLLNTDLHNPGVTRKMSCQEFINNLSQMHCGDCFSREELKALYNAIKQEPLRWPHADPAMMGFINLYYSGPPHGSFGPPGQPPSGILTPTGFYPHPVHPNAPMMLGAQPGHSASFNTYPPILQPSFQSPYNTMAGPSAAGGSGLPLPQTAVLGPAPPGYASPFYWNSNPISSSQMNANIGNPGSNPLALMTNPPVGESSGSTKANLITGTNPYIDLTAETNAREYMRGLLVRKWVMESHGKKTSLGRRGWKVYYARLRDLVLYLYKNAVVANAAARAEELHNLHQQQSQQHQNCMRQLAIQQQQQHLALLQSQVQMSENGSRMDHVNGDAKTNGEGDSSSAFVSSVCSFATMTTTTVAMANGESSAAGMTEPSQSNSNGSQPSSLSVPEVENGARILNSASDHASSDATMDDLVQTAPSTSESQTEISPLVPQSSAVQPCTSTTSSTSSSIAALPVSPTEAAPGAGGPVMSIPTPIPFTTTLPPTPISFPAPPSFIPPAIPPPEAVIRIAHAIASRATDYVKKPNVFRLKTREGAEYLFEVSDAKELDMWVERINFVAALLSAPSMPGPVSSERGFYRPHLPVTCTKLNMREQLEEHQRRLIELGRELTDLHKRWPNFSGSKTLKPTRAASISGRTSEAAKTAAAVAVAKISTAVPSSGELSNGTNENSSVSSESGTATNTDQVDESIEPFAATATSASSAPTTAAVTSASSSSAVSLISVFSTSSLGRRRKASSGSLCGTADTTLGPVLTAKQRTEHEERIQFTESEIQRYKTYARLLEAELFRIQQSSAAVAHAAALAAANNFSPYMNPYGALPANMPGFQHYGSIGIGSGGISFPSPMPGPPPRYFVPRDPAATYGAPSMLPLAVFGSDSLTEESSSSETQSDVVNPPSSVTGPSATGMGNPALPPVCSIPAAAPIAPRHRSLPFSYYGPQLAPPTPYSPSVSGRFYANPKQLRNPHHYRQQQQHGFGASGGFGRTNGLLMLNGGHHQLPEEEPISSESPPSPSAERAASVSSENSEQLISSSTGSTDKFKGTLQSSSSQPLCSTEGMFYEIV